MFLPVAYAAPYNPLTDKKLPARVYAILQTSEGDMTIELFGDIAPQHVRQISNLIALGCYDGVSIVRIHKGFVAQLAEVQRRKEPLSATQLAALKKLPLEASTALKHQRGDLSMARGNEWDSAESSFSFVLGAAPHLDGRYTLLGRVVRGAEVLDRLDELAVEDPYKPQRVVILVRAQLIDRDEALMLPLALPPIVVTKKTEVAPALFVSAIGILALALTTAIVAIRGMSSRVIACCALATYLAVFFWLYMLIVYASEQMAAWKPWIASLGFVGALFCFWMMGRFESAPGQKK